MHYTYFVGCFSFCFVFHTYVWILTKTHSIKHWILSGIISVFFFVDIIMKKNQHFYKRLQSRRINYFRWNTIIVNIGRLHGYLNFCLLFFLDSTQVKLESSSKLVCFYIQNDFYSGKWSYCYIHLTEIPNVIFLLQNNTS